MYLLLLFVIGRETRIRLHIESGYLHAHTYTQEGIFELTPKCRIIHPPLLTWGNMHAKLMVLVYPDCLRVVISSANLAREDWEQVGQTGISLCTPVHLA